MPKKKAKAPEKKKAKPKAKPAKAKSPAKAAKPKKKAKTNEIGPAPSLSGVSAVGEIAGFIWHMLETSEGKLSYTQVTDGINAPRDQVMQAVGWLAREGKLEIHENGRSKSVSLV